jgi:hypothetical protein
MYAARPSIRMAATMLSETMLYLLSTLQDVVDLNTQGAQLLVVRFREDFYRASDLQSLADDGQSVWRPQAGGSAPVSGHYRRATERR